VSLILVHSRERILPELSTELAFYAREKMEARGVRFKLGARVADATPGEVTLNNCETIATEKALREAATLAHNIHAVIRGEQKRPFSYRSLGSLAVLGHQTACAQLFGLKFSGLLAWWMWRTIYLAKLPTLEKKIRVALDWTIDLFFPRDIVQTFTFRKNGSLSKAEIQIKDNR